MRALAINNRRGFTYSEMLIAVMLMGLITAFVTPATVWLMRFSRGGSQQANFTMMARQSELRLTRYVQSALSAGAYSNRIQLQSTTGTVAQISYVDGDADPATLTDNIIQYDPNVWEDNDEFTICTHVCALPGEAMFTNVALSPMAVRFRYHIGEGTNVQYTSMFSSSPGFQGLEVRFSASPRNLLTLYQE